MVQSSLSLGLLKISIALNLLRLSKITWYFWTLWALIAFITIYSVAGAIPNILKCYPTRGIWETNIGAVCMSSQTYITYGLVNTGKSICLLSWLSYLDADQVSACNIFTDIALATVPLPIVWCLKMQPRVRFYVICILSLGYL